MTTAALNFALRPAKNVERKMMCEVFERLSRIAPLSQYRYIGFGSWGFYDHSLFHRRLGIHDMVSIENDEKLEGRVGINKPYKCIDMKWGKSTDHLPTLGWSKRSIVWLDYFSQLDTGVLDDIQTVTAEAVSGTFLIITVNAEPKPKKGEDIPGERFKTLVSKVGQARVPSEVRPKNLAKWGLAKVQCRIGTNEIQDVLNDRNAPIGSAQRLHYDQLFNFHYADGARMLTFGGLIANGADRSRFDPVGVRKLAYVRTSDDPYKIETPNLTLREIHFLDSRLPTTPSRIKDAGGLPASEVLKYRKIYRYFPSFSEVEI